MTLKAKTDPEKCQHYAGFMSHLNRRQFDALYWTLFITVILSLFIASWIYQSTMRIRDKPPVDEARYQKRLRTALALCSGVFLTSVVFIVIEVHALLALQFCEGENCMSLFWSTWTMLQLGSVIAILGIVLALWHHIYEVRHPMWALALGTPVLVVAGFGHVIQHFCNRCWKRAKDRRQRSRPCSGAWSTDEKDRTASSAATITADQDQVEDPERADSTAKLPPQLEPGQQEQQQEQQTYFFAMDVGDDKRVRMWPAFVGMSADGKAIIQLTKTTPYEGDGSPRP